MNVNDNSLRSESKLHTEPGPCTLNMSTENDLSSQHHLHVLYIDMPLRFQFGKVPISTSGGCSD